MDKTDKRENAKTEKTPEKPKKKTSKKADADFKRRYFDYYDDVKISDRQDW